MNTPNSISIALQHQRAGRVAEAEQVYKLLLQEQPHAIDALNLLGALTYDDRRFAEAQDYFETVLTLQPGAESHNSMGIVLKAQGKYAEAIEHYQKALALKPHQPEVLSNLGNVLKETGELEAAIAAYQEAIALNPAYAEAHNNLGIAYKDQQQLESAVACYETAMRLKPNYAEAYHNLGIVLRLQDKLDAAIAYFEQAIALKPTYAEAYTSLGSTLQQQGKLEAAIAQYQRLIELQPDSADSFNNLALALQQQQQTEAAIAAFQQALTLRPNFPGVLNNLGNLLLENKRLDEAIAAYQQAIEQRPNYPEAMNNLGNALQQKGDLEGAVAQYRQALELRPTFVEALSNLGAVLKDQNQLAESITCLEQAISLSPGIGEIYNNLGNAYQEQKRVEEAIACYRKAVELKPDMAEVHSNLGNMLQYVGEFEAAFDHFQQAIALQPDFAGVYNNLGIAYRNAGQVEAAFAAYDRALELNPDFVEAHWNKALNHLLLGNFELGFAGYEWRFQWSRFLEQNPARQYAQPRWDGSALNGKTILLYAEQGMGDTIQFIRYVPIVKANGGHIIVECHAPLINLLKTLPDIDQLIPLGAALPAFDVHAPLLSLPYILKTTLETIPAEVPYLRAEDLKPESSRQQAAAATSPSDSLTLSRPYFPTDSLSSIAASAPQPPTLHIGIVWDGNLQNPYNRVRTVPLAELLTLAEIPGVMLHSLQKEPRPEDIELLQAHSQVQDWRSHLHDFTDTAALIQACDLIISIDTAVTHLAGALGKPTWLLLPLAPDWRWLCDRSDSPWYPTLRLFRQTQYGDWQPVIAAVRVALEEKLQAMVGQQAAGRRPRTEAKRQKRSSAITLPPSSPTPPLPHALPASPTPPTPHLPAELRAVVKLYQAGQVEAARRDCATFLQTCPNSADGWHLLGLMAHHDRDLETAIAHYQKALKADATHLDTYNNLAVAFHEQGKLEEAIPHYQKALALKPDNPDAHNNYANALRERGQLDEAIYHYQQAIAARPEYADAYNNLGLAFYAKGDYANAATAYQQAIARKPNFPQALNHLGNALKELGNFAEAAKYYQQAIAIKPDYAKAYNNWGNIFRDEGDLQTAIQYYDQATTIAPDFAEAHWNKALTFLLGGDLERGFAEYEWRRQVNLPSFRSLRDFPGPRWDGSPLNGQLIYLHAEQGMGDIIQFVRYVPLVVERGGRVILECHPPLMHLLSQIPGVEQLVPYGSAPPAYHMQAPLLSLPYIFRTTVATVPAIVPYLHPPASAVKLPPPAPHPHPAAPLLKVGIVWSGNPENPYNRTRAVPLELLIPLAELPSVQLYSLQKELQPADQALLQENPQIYNLQPLMQDFVDTAALIQQLDLIISIDSAVTHLAGALGQSTWLLLPFAPDWRWMIHRDDSPWYPTLKIFRQGEAGDWPEVLQQVRRELQKATGEGQQAEDTRPQAAGEGAQRDSSQQLVAAFQHYESGQLEAAERSLRAVLRQQPDQPDALHILSVILCQTRRFEAAIHQLKQLVALAPEFAEGWRNLGAAFQEQGDFEAAIASYQQALKLDPHQADVHQNLSAVWLEVDQPFAAVTHAERLVALKPDAAEAHYNLGYALRRAGQVQAAIASYRQAIALNPDMATAHKNLGHALLLTGDFTNGFQEIEWRWQQPGWSRRPFTQPEWDGSDLTDKTILLFAEQGLGDTLQFIRYVPLVKAKGGTVIVECQPELVSLLAQRPDIDRLIPQDAPLPPFDVQAPLMSLPRILGTSVTTVPVEIPYLKAAGSGQQADGNHSPTHLLHPLTPPAALKVGLVWAGNPEHRSDRFRSCPLEQIRPLTEICGVDLFSLQKGEAIKALQAAPDLPILDLSERLHSFVDTATAIVELDLVITVDTAVAHLAGAMGKPVWVLLMFAADWRWIVDRDDTPWYPTMRLFRQTTPGDWAEVIERVRQELERLVERSKQQAAGSRQQLDDTTQNFPPPTHAPTHSPTAIPLHFSWPLDDYTDRGIFGTQLVLSLLANERFEPLLSQPITATSHINPLQRSRLQLLRSQAQAPDGFRLMLLDDRTQPDDLTANPAHTIGIAVFAKTHINLELIHQMQALRAIVVGSTWNAAVLQHYGLNPVQLPLHGVDPVLFQPHAQAELLRDRFVVFSNCCAEPSSQKLLLTAFKPFAARHQEALLLMAGTPLNHLHGVDPKQVLAIEAIPYPLLGQVLRAVDVVVFPSNCEVGINPTIAASFACGRPTILVNAAANQDLIQQNLGFPWHWSHQLQFPPGEVEAEEGDASVGEEFVETLEYIFTNPQAARTRGTIAADFIHNFSWSRIAATLIALAE